MSIWERLQSIWSSAKAAPARTQAHFTVDRSRVDRELGPPFVDGEHYFQIIINEMFLAKQREWFVTYEPVVTVSTSYLYGNSVEAMAFVVGPSMLGNKEEHADGFIFRNTPVTALHPYQGGPITITVMFSAVEHKNNATSVLSAVESFASVVDPLDPALSFGAYLKIADKLVDGLQALMGLNETRPIMGYRITVNPDVMQVLEPMHLVLIDTDEAAISADDFNVTDSRLRGPDGKQYRDHDFVLLELAQGTKRTDVRTLPFFALWEQTRDLAMKSSNQHYWGEAKSNFNSLKRALRASPDLTEPDYDRLRDEYLAEMTRYRTEAVRDAELARSDDLSDNELEMRAIAKKLDELDEL